MNKDIIKKAILPLILFGILLLVIFNLNNISNFVSDLFNGNHKILIMPKNKYSKEIVIEEKSENRKSNEYMFVKPTDDFEPYSYQDLLNIFYSTINNGWTNFTFYCPTEYKDCIDDISKISEDSILLTHLNNFAHPYNSFSNLKTLFEPGGEVTIKIEHLYTEEQIEEIDKKADEIIDKIITNDMDDQTKILTIHDYIVNNTKYDIVKNETNESKYLSNTAYGALLQGYAICGGYADSMAIFLTKLGFNNYKIASTTHVWNAVYVPNKDNVYEWKHLDLTWDDPVSEKDVDYLYHKYFLVNDQELKDADGDLNNHDYDSSVYLEFKKKS